MKYFKRHTPLNNFVRGWGNHDVWGSFRSWRLSTKDSEALLKTSRALWVHTAEETGNYAWT